MAPTIFRTKNLKVVIYPKDHPPPHVHVIGPNAEAKFDIQTLELILAYGFNERDLLKIQEALAEKQSYLREAWYEWQD